jgi:hypothetical protein
MSFGDDEGRRGVGWGCFMAVLVVLAVAAAVCAFFSLRALQQAVG